MHIRGRARTLSQDACAGGRGAPLPRRPAQRKKGANEDDFDKKEQGLLKDLQNEEKLCVEKYRKAAENACDAQAAAYL